MGAMFDFLDSEMDLWTKNCLKFELENCFQTQKTELVSDQQILSFGNWETFLIFKSFKICKFNLGANFRTNH